MTDSLLWDRVHNTKTLVRSFQDTVTVTASKNQEVFLFRPAPPMQRTVSRYDAWVRGGEAHRAEAAEHHLGLNPNLWVIHARFGWGLTDTCQFRCVEPPRRAPGHGFGVSAQVSGPKLGHALTPRQSLIFPKKSHISINQAYSCGLSVYNQVTLAHTDFRNKSHSQGTSVGNMEETIEILFTEYHLNLQYQ